MMDAEECRRLLSYDPDSGQFRWRVSGRGRRVGLDAGHLVPSNGYVLICINYFNYPAHRLAYLMMTGRFPDEVIDHINGIRHDNRWANLRPVTPFENSRNRSCNATKSGGFTGVYFHSPSQRWYAQSCEGGKNIHLGMFGSFEEAVCARKAFQIANGYHENHGRPHYKQLLTEVPPQADAMIAQRSKGRVGE